MLKHKGFHSGRIGFAGSRIGSRSDLLILEPLHGGNRKERDRIHAGTPLLSVRLLKQQRHTARRNGIIRRPGVAAGDGKASRYRRRRALREQRRAREGAGVAGCPKLADDADPFGVIAPIPRMFAARLLQCRNQLIGGETLRRQPAAGP